MTAPAFPPPPDLAPVRRALISVSDKTGLIETAQALAAAGVELVSTGGTRAAIALSLASATAPASADPGAGPAAPSAQVQAAQASDAPGDAFHARLREQAQPSVEDEADAYRLADDFKAGLGHEHVLDSEADDGMVIGDDDADVGTTRIGSPFGCLFGAGSGLADCGGHSFSGSP